MATRPPVRRPVARTPAPKAEGGKPSGRRTRIIIVAVVLAVIALSIGIGYYLIYVAPFQRAIITINDVSISYDYFIRRMKYVDQTNDIYTMLMVTIPDEELIRQGAPRYGIEVTPEEVDELLRAAARGENESISESEFKAWYREQLNEIRLSDAEYREFVSTYMLAERLQAYLAARTPTVTEQVHFHYMLLSSYEDTVAAKERLDNGEDFIELARELSIDEETKEQGGDIGWWPKGALTTVMASMFDEDAGFISQPVIMDEEGTTYAIFMITERQLAREIEEDKLEILQEMAIEDWLDNEMTTNKITLHGRNNGFDSETYAWISWQLSKE